MDETPAPLHGSSVWMKYWYVLPGLIALLVLVFFFVYKGGFGVSSLQAPTLGNYPQVYVYSSPMRGDSTSPNRIDFSTLSLDFGAAEASSSRASFALPQPTSVITDSGKKGTVLLLTVLESATEIRAIDLSTWKMNLLATIPSGASEYIGVPRLIDAGTALAYVRHTTTGGTVSQFSVITRDIQKGTETSAPFQVVRSIIYEGVSVIGESSDGTMLFLEQSGGDGGNVGSQWYLHNRKTGATTAIKDMPHFLTGDDTPAPAALSPDGDRIAYADFSVQIPPEAIERNDPAKSLNGCLKISTGSLYMEEGGVVLVRDVRTGVNTEVFQNEEFQNNQCSNEARKIQDIKWIDATKLLVETRGGLYIIDLTRKSSERVFSFKNAQPMTTPPRIAGSALPYVLFSDNTVGTTQGSRLMSWTSSEISFAHLFLQ